MLRSIDTSHVAGLRDRALLGTLAYTGARIGAIARLRRGDLEDQGPQRVLRFREKGGKQREIPVRHDLDRWLGEYLEAAGIEADPKESPLFRSALGKQKQLSPRPLSANSMGLMLKRRLKDVGAAPRSSAPTASASWWSPTCSPRTCRLRTCSTWPATPTPEPPRSMTGGGGALPGILWSGFPCEAEG